MTQIDGKHVLLTGGSRGIGPVIAETLARRGAHIALAARSQEGLSQVAESLEVIVNSTPQRLFYALKELSPSLADWLMCRFGAVDFQRKKVGL